MNDRNHQKLIEELTALGTEQVNPDTTDIDTLSPLEICTKINREDHKVAEVVSRALPEIAKAAEIAANTWKSGGRIIYIGAGTSGRLGVLDAAECPPTFGIDPSRTVGLISGGYDTLILSKEGAEDHTDWAIEDLKRIGLTANDFVVGIAASVRTPYTQAGIAYAQKTGCKTALVVCNDANSIKTQPDVMIILRVGPEAITGSTRMKSGTAQKMTLNMITTTAAVLTGRTYGNMMVDLMARSEKLHARSRKILMEFLKIDYETADELLRQSGGSVKTAIVMKRLAISRDEAKKRLHDADGFLRRVIG
ncbi:MAG: N-acetylmuramic acid 6-phosphate etherase [candidate division Zixibacteria bacterium]|nr:N-acetylmuramic acid 6-phosphate etherase [candidate division Zixibacteria bacterium]